MKIKNFVLMVVAIISMTMFTSCEKTLETPAQNKTLFTEKYGFKSIDPDYGWDGIQEFFNTDPGSSMINGAGNYGWTNSYNKAGPPIPSGCAWLDDWFVGHGGSRLNLKFDTPMVLDPDWELTFHAMVRCTTDDDPENLTMGVRLNIDDVHTDVFYNYSDFTTENSWGSHNINSGELNDAVDEWIAERDSEYYDTWEEINDDVSLEFILTGEMDGNNILYIDIIESDPGWDSAPIITGATSINTNVETTYYVPNGYEGYVWTISGACADIHSGAGTKEITLVGHCPGTITLKCKVEHNERWSTYRTKTIYVTY